MSEDAAFLVVFLAIDWFIIPSPPRSIWQIFALSKLAVVIAANYPGTGFIARLSVGRFLALIGEGR